MFKGVHRLLIATTLVLGVACADQATSDLKAYSQGNLTECLQAMRGAMSQYSRTSNMDNGSTHHLISEKVLPLIEKATYTLGATKIDSSNIEKINAKGTAKLEKLSTSLRTYNQALKKNDTEKIIHAKTEVKTALEDFENWLKDVEYELREHGIGTNLAFD